MPVNRRVVAIYDDKVGEGVDLAFPQMSSCCACICVLTTKLVGIHKTQGWYSGSEGAFAYALGLIDEPVSRLYLAGWSVNDDRAHNVGEIRTKLNCTNIPTYTCDFGNTTKTIGTGKKVVAFKTGWKREPMTDLCTFASLRPDKVKIRVKRTSKVVQVGRDWKEGDAVEKYAAGFEDLETPSEDLNQVEFVRV